MTTPLGRFPVWKRQPPGSGRVRMLSLPSGIEAGPEDIVAAPADDQKHVAGEVGIDGHDVVAERLVETGRRRGGLHGDLLVQVDVFGRHLGQGRGVHGVDERLHVRVEYLRRLGLGADVGQIQTVAADQRRQELVGEHPLRVVRVDGVSCRQGRVRAEDERVGWAGRGFRAEVRAVGGEAGIGERGEGDFGDRRLALPAGKAWTTPRFPRSRASPTVERGVDEGGVEFGEDLGDEDRFVRVIAGRRHW